MVWSARIVLVLKFHRTLATPEAPWLVSVHHFNQDQTQTKVLVAYNGIKNSIYTKTLCALHTSYKVVHSNVSKNSFSSIYSWIIYKRQQFQQPSDRLLQQSNHQTWGERPPFPPKCSLCFSKLHNCRVHLREEKWELSLRLCLVGELKIQV